VSAVLFTTIVLKEKQCSTNFPNIFVVVGTALIFPNIFVEISTASFLTRNPDKISAVSFTSI